MNELSFSLEKVIKMISSSLEINNKKLREVETECIKYVGFLVGTIRQVEDPHSVVHLPPEERAAFVDTYIDPFEELLQRKHVNPILQKCIHSKDYQLVLTFQRRYSLKEKNRQSEILKLEKTLALLYQNALFFLDDASSDLSEEIYLAIVECEEMIRRLKPKKSLNSDEAHVVKLKETASLLRANMKNCLEQQDLKLLEELHQEVVKCDKEIKSIESEIELKLKAENQQNSHKIKLTCMGLTDEDVTRYLIPTLNRMPSLRKIDLSDNFITEKGLAVLLQSLKQAELTHIKLCNNFIRCDNVLRWETEFEKPLQVARRKNLRKLERIDLSNNYIHSHSKDLIVSENAVSGATRSISREMYKDTLTELLNFTSLSLHAFLKSPKEDLVECCQANWSLAQKLKVLQKELGKATLLDAVAFLKMGIETAFLMSQRNIDFNQPFCQWNTSQQSLAVKEILKFHNSASLASRLERHRFYHSEYRESKSVISHELLSLGTSYVYLLAKKKDQHAMLAFECVTPNGQRVFEVAHLAVSGSHVFIEYHERELDEFLKEFDKKYTASRFNASYFSCKSLWGAIDHEVKYGLSKDTYSLIVLFEDQMNCLTWGKLKIEEHLKLSLDKYISVGHAPRATVNNLSQNALYESPKSRHPTKSFSATFSK